MAATKIKISIDSIWVLKSKLMAGPGSWQIDAKVIKLPSNKTVTLGDPAKMFEARAEESFDVKWDATIDIDPADTQIKVTVKIKDASVVVVGDMGVVEATLALPQNFRRLPNLDSSKKRFNVTIDFKSVEATPGFSGPVTTILQRDGSDTRNTIHCEMQPRLAHISPVIPVPWEWSAIPVPRGIEAMMGSHQFWFGIPPEETIPNQLVNPAVIPVLDPLDAGFFPDHAAVLRVTQKWPIDLDETDLFWKSNSERLKFWVGSAVNQFKGGEIINAFALLGDGSDEEVTAELHWDSPSGPLLATFRAIVGKIKYVWMRAIIVKTSKADSQNPVVTAADIKAQLTYCNILLWQVGIQLVLDTDPAIYDDVTPIPGEPGIFEVTTAENYTFNIVDDDKTVATRFNAREGVYNVAYIHSVEDSPNLLGMATDRRFSTPDDGKGTANGTASDKGSPSASWIRPSGVFPDDAAGEITMKTMGASKSRGTQDGLPNGDGNIDKLCGCLMTQLSVGRKGDNTLAHELAHVLGLHHRGNGGHQDFASYDDVNQMAGPHKGRGHPWVENVMCYGPTSLAQDFDILQAKVMRSHKLLRDTPPPQPKQPRKPVPTAWLPDKADIQLLQEYLTGKKTGLQHKGYNLGDYGPGHDGVDGILGKETKQAIKDFQKDHGNLKIDGIYGPKTRAAFNEELNANAE